MARMEKQDAIAMLKADHRKVEELFEKFDKARSAKVKKTLADQICMELSIHMMLEEEIFYPACAEEVEEDLRLEAYVEHDGAKILISELEESNPDEDFYDAKMTVLSEQIKHHVKEEEKPGEGLFAQARKAKMDLEVLGQEMMARKEELMFTIKTKGMPELETRSFTGHHLEQGQRVTH